MKLGFLFGAGAEVGYGLPSGGEFALGIFKQDDSESKEQFKKMRDRVIPTQQEYAMNWLGETYAKKKIMTFGARDYEHIIKDTLEHNKVKIKDTINDFDKIIRDGKLNIIKEKGIEKNVNEDIENLLGKNIGDEIVGPELHYNESLDEYDKLFKSEYFSALLMLCSNDQIKDETIKEEISKILVYIIELHLGAMADIFANKINNKLIEDINGKYDFINGFGRILKIDYKEAGMNGIKYVLNMKKAETSTEESRCLYFAQRIIEKIYVDVFDYKTLIDANWHYLYSPSIDWAKFCKMVIFLLNVREYILYKAKNIDRCKTEGYYHDLKELCKMNKETTITAVATTNYNKFIYDILNLDITYLNGSTEMWYDPYLNKIGRREDLDRRHILVPLIFTQSGTKPMTSIDMAMKYVDTYTKWKESDVIVVVGFGFGKDDEHINNIIRKLIDEDNKKIAVVSIDENLEDKDIQNKLHVTNRENISVITVDEERKTREEKLLWLDKILHM